MTIKFSCGYCGAPLDEDCNEIYPVPDDYNPADYPNEVCKCCSCEIYEQEQEKRYITREMALDAGDPDLEGQLY